MKMFKKILVLAAAVLVAGSMFISCGNNDKQINAFLDEMSGYVKELEDLVEGDTAISTSSQLDFLQDLQNQMTSISNKIINMENNDDYKDLPEPSEWKSELKERYDELESRYTELMDSATRQLGEIF
jgi:hypothetical protein